MAKFKKRLTWSYSKLERMNIYFGFISHQWKRTIYRNTVEYALRSCNKQIDKLVKQQRLYSMFNLSQEEIKKIEEWRIHVNIPPYNKVKHDITRYKIGRFKNMVECTLSCKVTILLY